MCARAAEEVRVVGDGTWLTVGEAAKLLRVDVGAVRRAVDAGKLVAGRTPGGHRRVSAESVERMRRELYPGEEQQDS